MSARDDLINGLTEHACCFSEQDAKKMADDFAHELAEQILGTCRAWGWVPDMNADDAADLIDPVKEGP